MSDIIDRAQEREEYLRAEALRARETAIVETPRYARDGKRICMDCYERLSPQRLRANPQAVRCVECQETHERREGR